MKDVVALETQLGLKTEEAMLLLVTKMVD